MYAYNELHVGILRKCASRPPRTLGSRAARATVAAVGPGFARRGALGTRTGHRRRHRGARVEGGDKMSSTGFIENVKRIGYGRTNNKCRLVVYCFY